MVKGKAAAKQRMAERDKDIERQRGAGTTWDEIAAKVGRLDGGDGHDTGHAIRLYWSADDSILCSLTRVERAAADAAGKEQAAKKQAAKKQAAKAAKAAAKEAALKKKQEDKEAALRAKEEEKEAALKLKAETKARKLAAKEIEKGKITRNLSLRVISKPFF